MDFVQIPMQSLRGKQSCPGTQHNFEIDGHFLSQSLNRLLLAALSFIETEEGGETI